MQQVLIVLLIAAAFGGVLFLAGGFDQPAPTPSPIGMSPDDGTQDPGDEDAVSEEAAREQRPDRTGAEPERARQARPSEVRLEIGRVKTWNGSPVTIPVWLESNASELSFTITFPNHLVRVLDASSSANWDTRIVRRNELGEIRVHAVRREPISGREQLLTLQMRRIDHGRAELAIPASSLQARFPNGERREPTVRITSGLLTAPF